MKADPINLTPASFMLGENPILGILGPGGGAYGGGVPIASNVSGAVPEVAGLPFMTPDVLMMFCETKLHDLDSQMQSQFAEEKKNYDAQQIFQRINADISSVSGGFSTDDKNFSGMPHAGPKLLKQIEAEMDAATDPTIKSQLKQLFHDVAAQVGGERFATDISARPQILDDMINLPPDVSDTDFFTQHGYTTQNQSGTAKAMITPEVVSSWTNQVKTITDGMNNDAQLGMIKLQSIMSDRQNAVQLCTNLVQALDDQMNKVVGNVGH